MAEKDCRHVHITGEIGACWVLAVAVLFGGCAIRDGLIHHGQAVKTANGCQCKQCETPEPTVCAVCGMHLNQPRTYEEEPPSPQWDTEQDEPLPAPTQGVIPFEVERVSPEPEPAVKQ